MNMNVPGQAADCVSQVVVVTGGSQGIGRGICEAFLATGATVVIADLQEPANFDSWKLAVREQSVELDSTRSDQSIPEVAEQLFWVKTNVCSSDSISALCVFLEQKFGRVNVLVNNAGVMFERSIDEQSEEDWDRMMAVNLKAPFLMVKGLLPGLEEQAGNAYIVNIGSIEGFSCNPRHTAYSASKGGVHGLTVAMAVDLGPRGIRVNAIAPGWINTDLNREYLETVGDIDLANSELARLHPVGSIGSVADIGNVAVWLASPASAFVAGELITVDGARTRKLSLPEIFGR